MKNFLKKILLTALVTSVVIVSGCSDDDSNENNSSRGSATGNTNGGKKVALFSLPSPDGREVEVRTPAVLFFFTSWCGVCKQVLPEVKRLYPKALERGWNVYGIDSGESLSVAKNFINNYRLDIPTLVDTNNSITSRYNIRGFPTFVMINSSGKIIYQGHGIPPGL